MERSDRTALPQYQPLSVSNGPGEVPSARALFKKKIFTIITVIFICSAALPIFVNNEFVRDSDLYKEYLLKMKTLTWSRQIQKTRTAVKDMRAMLEEYYGGPEILIDTFELPDHNKEIHEKGIQTLAHKMARAMVWKDQFVVGAIGNSVTAGHDNCNYDSYEQQLERLMKPIWSNVYVNFEVRNAGTGSQCGDTFKNQIWCMRNLVGDDVDVIQYSWTYDEKIYNTAGGVHDGDNYHEMFFRWALQMEHSPAPQILYTGGDIEGEASAELKDSDRQLLDQYGGYGANILTMTRGIAKHGYRRHGVGGGDIGDTVHNTTRYGETEGAVRRDSLGVVFRNWNPGPLLYQTTADALAYYYSSAMLLALDMVEAESHPFLKWTEKPLETPALPEALQCRKEWCSVKATPSCIDFEKPTFGQPQVTVKDPDIADEDVYRGGREAPWIEWEGDGDLSLIPREERDMAVCPHADKCAGFQKGKNVATRRLTFGLPAMQTGFVAMCCSEGADCGKKMLQAGVEFALQNVTVTTGYEEIFGKCVQVQARWQAEGKIDGDLEVSIKFPKDSETFTISHVIGL